VLVAVVSFVVYALRGNQAPLGRDLGTFVYGGEHVAHGVPPYVGIFNSVGPLADAVPGVAIWLGHFIGAEPVLAARLLFLVLSAVACGLVSVLARDTFHSRAAGFVAPAVFLTFLEFLELAGSGPREKTTMVVFMVAGMILLGRRRWLGAGVCTALATLTWQPVLAVMIAALVAAVLLSRPQRRRAVALFFAGGLIPSAVTVAYFASQGVLRTAIDGFIVVNLTTHQPGVLSAPRNAWKFLWGDYRYSIFIAIAGLVGMLVVAALATVRVVRDRADRSSHSSARPDERLVVVGAGALAGTVWTVNVMNGGPDLFVLLPFAALGVTGVLLLAISHVPRPVAVGVVALATLVGVLVAGTEAVGTRNDLLVQQRADVDAVLDTQPSSATVLSVDAPQVLALADRTNPSSYQLFDPAMQTYLDAHLVGGLVGYGAELRRLHPTFVVVCRTYHRPWLSSMLEQDYRSAGHASNWTWYISRSAGERAWARAHVANERVMHERRSELSPRVVPGRVLHRDRAHLSRHVGRSRGRPARHRHHAAR
jgi:hypothetical protein